MASLVVALICCWAGRGNWVLAQPPPTLLPSLIQRPAPAFMPAQVCVLARDSSVAVGSGSPGDMGCAGPLGDPTEVGW